MNLSASSSADTETASMVRSSFFVSVEVVPSSRDFAILFRWRGENILGAYLVED